MSASNLTTAILAVFLIFYRTSGLVRLCKVFYIIFEGVIILLTFTGALTIDTILAGFFRHGANVLN